LFIIIKQFCNESELNKTNTQKERYKKNRFLFYEKYEKEAGVN